MKTQTLEEAYIKGAVDDDAAAAYWQNTAAADAAIAARDAYLAANPSVFKTSARKTPQAALDDVIEYAFENERKHFVESGQPADHVFYDLLRLTKASNENPGKDELNFTREDYASLNNVVGQMFTDERRHWMEAGRPDKHVFADLLVLGRELIKHKAKEVERGGPERESDTHSAALRGHLSPPVAAPAPVERSPAAPGPGE